MGAFLPLLALAAGPIVRAVLKSIGIGIITYAGLSTLISALSTHVQTAYGAMPASVAQIADLLGVGTAIGIILGAIAARATYAAISKIGSITT
jgi:hypothetical protein